MTASVRWVKGHGAENDFLLLPDYDGQLHANLTPALVAALCHRRRGIGADGVIRVVRCAADVDPAAQSASDEAEWFMDYRNGDGSLAQMCGNGLRVFARYLADEGLIDPARPVAIATRSGTKPVRFANGEIAVEMGPAEVSGPVEVSLAGRTYPALSVHVGNPHAVVFVDDLATIGGLSIPPSYDAADFPDGVNVEFAVRRGARRLALRVHERGAGETRSCGTGACAAAVAAGHDDGDGAPSCFEVEMPGGRLLVRRLESGTLELSGPAEIVGCGKFYG